MTDLQTESGLEAIREALRVRNTLYHFANLARDLNVGVATLEAFAFGRAGLPDHTLQLLVTAIFHGHLYYDFATDKLRPVMKEPPRSMGARPENNAVSTPYTPGPSRTPHVLVREANTIPQPKRMSWLERWF